MILTNNLNLPDPIVEAVRNDPYSKGDSDISITGVIAPPRIRVLSKKHADELTEDVSDRIYSLLGQVMHDILHRASITTNKLKTAIYERRWYMDIEGVKISGQLDAYYSDGLIQDYKLVSLYSVKDGVKPEYEQQLNAYAALLRHNGLAVQKLELVCILRDWSKGKAKQDVTLPQQQIIKLSVPIWSEEKALQFLTDRVRLHKAANKKLPQCTADERWATPDKFAVMAKKGAARSLKNHDTLEQAEIHAGQIAGAFVELRPGVNNRCENYCLVSRWCSQFAALKKGKK